MHILQGQTASHGQLHEPNTDSRTTSLIASNGQ